MPFETVGVVAGLIMAAGGVAVYAVARLGRQGRLPRQNWAGIRVPSTMRSDEAWRAAHVAAAAPMMFAGVGAALGGLGSMIFTIAGVEMAFVWFVLGGAFCLLTGLTFGTVSGVSAARKVH